MVSLRTLLFGRKRHTFTHEERLVSTQTRALKKREAELKAQIDHHTRQQNLNGLEDQIRRISDMEDDRREDQALDREERLVEIEERRAALNNNSEDQEEQDDPIEAALKAFIPALTMPSNQTFKASSQPTSPQEAQDCEIIGEEEQPPTEEVAWTDDDIYTLLDKLNEKDLALARRMDKTQLRTLGIQYFKGYPLEAFDRAYEILRGGLYVRN